MPPEERAERIRYLEHFPTQIFFEMTAEEREIFMARQDMVKQREFVVTQIAQKNRSKIMFENLCRDIETFKGDPEILAQMEQRRAELQSDCERREAGVEDLKQEIMRQEQLLRDLVG